MKNLDMKKIYKDTLMEAKNIICKTLMDDVEYFNRYFKDQKDKLEDNTYEQLTRYFQIVYHAHRLEPVIENELNDYQKECVENGIYLNWNLDNRTDIEISLPFLLDLLDKAQVVYKRDHYYMGDNEVSPTRMMYSVDRYATRNLRKQSGIDKPNLNDLMDKSSFEEFESKHTK